MHKSVLIAAACVTDKEALSAIFYVRQFIASDSDIRLMAEWFAPQDVQDVYLESTRKYCLFVYEISCVTISSNL